jgi:integrase
MSDEHSTPAAAPAKPAKPEKPYPEFPLFPHAAGVWAKKIRGQLHYFGPWADPDGALARYLGQKDALHAGRDPRPDTGAATVKDLANAFLNAKQALVDAGELSPRTWADYKRDCDLVVAHFGKGRLVADLRPADFAGLRAQLARRWGHARVGATVQRVRVAFRFAYDNDLIGQPVRFGSGFSKPSAKTMRKHRAERGAKLFTAEEVRRMVGAAGHPLKAMILLGINAGFGNSDVGNLPEAALDLEGGWVDYPRPKTGIARRCPLWPETTAALKEALAIRPAPKDPKHAGRVFLTKRGLPWAGGAGTNSVTYETALLLQGLGINGHRNFYTLRHTFRTVADEARDQPAADHMMGHEVPHMSSVYRETIGDERLRGVSDHVHDWLFPPTAPDAKPQDQAGEKQ